MARDQHPSSELNSKIPPKSIRREALARFPIFRGLDACNPVVKGLLRNRYASAVICCAQNERPLQGLAGELDWQLQGALSRMIRWGRITGEKGECVLFPIRAPQASFAKNPAPPSERIFQLILLGIGPTARPGERHSLPVESLSLLRSNLKRLSLPLIGVSLSDFGLSSEAENSQKLTQLFQGVALCIEN
jgi:hypothetical protein